MSRAHKSYHFGLFSVELPPLWQAEELDPATLALHAPGQALTLTLMAANPQPTRELRTQTAVSPADLHRDLLAFLADCKGIRRQSKPTTLAGAHQLIAAVDGTQPLKARASLLQRLLRRVPTLHWRFFVAMNRHIRVRAHTCAAPDTLRRHEADIQQILASLRLPRHRVLVGKPFVDAVANLARHTLPGLRISTVDEATIRIGQAQVDLTGLHREYLLTPEHFVRLVRGFLMDLQETADTSELDGEWETARDFIMPILVDGDRLARMAPRVVHQEWVNGLHIVYGIDNRGTFRPIAPEEADLWLTSVDELHEYAMENLMTRSADLPMEITRTADCVALTMLAADPYNASRVLLPNFHATLRTHLGSTFYISIPSRHRMLAFATDAPDAISRFRNQARMDYHRVHDKVCDKLFLATADGIAGDPAVTHNAVL